MSAAWIKPTHATGVVRRGRLLAGFVRRWRDLALAFVSRVCLFYLRTSDAMVESRAGSLRVLVFC